MKKYQRILFFVFILFSFPLVVVAVESDQCQIAQKGIGKASVIRGLPIKKPVPCLVHQKEEIKKFLVETIKKQAPAEKLAMEELVFKTLGIISKDYDYKKGIIDLYLSQIGGYYDPEKEHFVMAGWIPSVLQTTVAVHEQTHALQDQYFGLDKFLDPLTMSTDQLLARSALVEGDATAVMFDFSREMTGQGGIAEMENVNSLLFQNILGASLVGGSSGVPQTLQSLLIFPYTSGLRFAHVLLQNGGYREIDKAFSKPPQTTEEVLHPEKYQSGKKEWVKIEEEELRELSGLGDQKLQYSDTFGEFGISVVLMGQIKDHPLIGEATQGWGGDLVGVFVDPSCSGHKLVWKTIWDTQKDAEQFYGAYQSVSAKLGLDVQMAGQAVTAVSSCLS